MQGVLHNPRSDKRTTQGSFHIAEGGLDIAADKYRVPKATFAKILSAALNPPDSDLLIPFTAGLIFFPFLFPFSLYCFFFSLFFFPFFRYWI